MKNIKISEESKFKVHDDYPYEVLGEKGTSPSPKTCQDGGL
jgi:hypothetical protein